MLSANFINDGVGLGAEQENLLSLFLLHDLIKKPKHDSVMSREKGETGSGSEEEWIEINSGALRWNMCRFQCHA